MRGYVRRTKLGPGIFGRQAGPIVRGSHQWRVGGVKAKTAAPTADPATQPPWGLEQPEAERRLGTAT